MIFKRDDGTSQSTKTSSKLQLIDPEFGVISYRRSPQARYVRLRVTEDGHVKASLPKRAPLYLVKELLESSREEIRKLLASTQDKRTVYTNGMKIGHSHSLALNYDDIEEPKGKLKGQIIDVTLPLDYDEQPDLVQAFVSTQVKRALRREATAYLPRRLQYLADMYGFEYERERFGNQRGRWGSCSSSGTISLNVALMNLPHDLIDYVLVHELSHTRQMNHSAEFWSLVESCLPGYRESRKLLKTMSPIC